MKHTTFARGSTAVAILVFSGLAHSSAWGDPIQIAISLTEPNWRRPCPSSSEAFVVSGELAPASYIASVLVIDDEANTPIRGVRFSVAYDAEPNSAVDIFGWHACGGKELPSLGWPSNGTSNMVLWDESTPTESGESYDLPGKQVRVAGYFYCSSYSQGTLSLAGIGNGGIQVLYADGELVSVPIGSQSKAQRVEEVENYQGASSVGYAAFSSGMKRPGYNPVHGIQATVVSPVAQIASPRQWGMTAAWDRKAKGAMVTLQVVAEAPVTLTIHDIAGRRVTTIANETHFEVGEHVFIWNGKSESGRDVSSGIFFLRATAGTVSLTTKMVVIR